MTLLLEYFTIIRSSMKLTMTSLSVFCVITFFLNADFNVAMLVTSSGPQTIQKAQGDQETLGCTYTPAPSDTGDLDIEWSKLSPDMTQKDELILSFTGGKKYVHGDAELMKRVVFTAGDPSLGDASISISALEALDTATYQCKVKKSPGVDMRKVTLLVMVPPSIPKCWVEGSEEIGGDVSLHCRSTKGSAPLNYMWARESGGSLPSTAIQNAQTGVLLIRNHSTVFMGNYRCEVTNLVGKQECTYALQALKPTNKAGVIAGSVIGALLLLVLLLLLIWLLVCLCHKRRYEKEVANEIRVDAPPPESRPGSRNSSFRSVMGYRAHPGVAYSSVKKSQRTGSEHSSVYTNRSKPLQGLHSNGQTAPAVAYDHEYGYAV